MRIPILRSLLLFAALALSMNLIDGCAHRTGMFAGPSMIPPQGTLSDPMWQIQEDNAEPSKFVIYQHEWTLGDVVIWDNTGTMHRVLPYPLDCGRLMHRTQIAGDEPFA